MKLKNVAILVAVLVVLDQALKIWIKTHLCIDESIEIFSWFQLRFVENNGAAFGMQIANNGGFDWGKLLLSSFRMVMIGLLGYYICHLARKREGTPRGVFVGLAMIFAGALADVFVLLAAPEVLPLGIAIPAVSAAIVAFMIFQYVMPLQARFENSPMNVLKHACILAVSYFPRTVLMTVLWAVPVYCFLKLTVTWPLVLMFGISLPGYFCARLYRPVFWKLEDNMEEQ